MKKISLIAILFLAACSSENKDLTTETEAQVIETPDNQIDDHNSQNALDWEGSYSGTLPCADCEGIEWTLNIAYDLTYTLNQTYLTADELQVNSEGEFEWNENGSQITLLNEDEKFNIKVGENYLQVLDTNGKIIEGNLAEFYILSKK